MHEGNDLVTASGIRSRAAGAFTFVILMLGSGIVAVPFGIMATALSEAPTLHGGEEQELANQSSGPNQ